MNSFDVWINPSQCIDVRCRPYLCSPRELHTTPARLEYSFENLMVGRYLHGLTFRNLALASRPKMPVRELCIRCADVPGKSLKCRVRKDFGELGAFDMITNVRQGSVGC